MESVDEALDIDKDHVSSTSLSSATTSASSTTGKSQPEDDRIFQRIVDATFRSTDVHVHGEAVWISWSEGENKRRSIDRQRADQLNYLSTSVHLNGEQVWNSWPQQDDARPVYCDSTSITTPDRRLRFVENRGEKTSVAGAVEAL